MILVKDFMKSFSEIRELTSYKL